MNTSIVQHVFNIDIATIMKVLSLENMLFGILVSMYRLSQQSDNHGKKLQFYSISKYIQAAAWIFIDSTIAYQSNVLMFAGNTVLFIGVLIESRVILGTIGVRRDIANRVQTALFLSAVFFFYLRELSMDNRRGDFFLSHLIITILFVFPAIICVFRSGGSRLKIVMGALYFLFFLSSIYRYALESLGFRFFPGTPMLDEGLFFYMFVSIMFVGGTGFLLLVKEDDDRKLREMAYLDSLTGLLNRRHFGEEASVSLARHVRSGKEMAMLFIDIDYFKKVNDTYGHKFGDEVLRNLASLMRKTVRTTDLACRWGGEEFVILLSESGAEHARMVARRIQQGISFSTFAAHGDFSYTVSVGIFSTVPRSGPEDTLESFIEKSDRAMYRAKVLGRNRVEVFGADMPPFAPA
jgi:diguanylate cyclase (GGDEF)-like protein